MGIVLPGQTSNTIDPQSIAKPVKKPSIDLGACTKCGGCIEVAPHIFRFNEPAGYLEVCDLDSYDQELVDEAIKNCPEDCIYWEED